ncbi:transposase [Cytophagales bacterium LB-30]|uniref:Transposase n=1 Tax=Shiella aurantiaca TaxID=3058365 RepID=A0ABT8F6Y3_9BACT|nr:transposase [Shiella aurantiaca]MDN4166215.1 transposase [Shiella aurantiaca]
MAFAYIVRDQSAVHFVIFTVHQWVDVFTRQIYSEELVKNLRYCQENKGLEVYGWVIMSNHIHLILRAKNENLSDIIRDFKKYTAKKIYQLIKDNPEESRKAWLLTTLSFEGRVWFWEEGYHGEEIWDKPFFQSKLDYIHLNPVRAGIVAKEEDYLNSSAADCYGLRTPHLLPLVHFG